MGVYNEVVVYFHGTSHCASFKCHRLTENCCRPCLALHDPVTNLLMAASNSLTLHIKQLNLVNGFLNMTMSSPYSNGLYSQSSRAREIYNMNVQEMHDSNMSILASCTNKVSGECILPSDALLLAGLCRTYRKI